MGGHRLNLSTLVFSVAVIIVISHSAQSLPLKHSPRFLRKLAATGSPFAPPQFHYETRYFQQRLDHFSFSELPTFPQRYLISTEHWVGPQRLGPIFFYCGNEGDIEWFAQNTGFVWEIAPRFGAMVVFPEVSLPLPLPNKLSTFTSLIVLKRNFSISQLVSTRVNVAASILRRVYAFRKRKGSV